MDSVATAVVKPKPGAIGGQVISTNKKAIAGATVNCGTAGTATTNSTGNYSITTVPSATSYECMSTAVGYIAKAQTVTVIPGITATANFALVRS